MLPPIRVTPRRKTPRYRPITSSDTAATTGLAVNPVGAMIPTSSPTNAVYGPQGRYGAMLPTNKPNPYGLLGNIASGVNAAANYAQNTILPVYVNIEQQKLNAERQIWNNFKNTVSNLSRNTSTQAYGTLGVVAPGLALGLMNSQQPGGVGGAFGTHQRQDPNAYFNSEKGRTTPANFVGANSFTSGAGSVNLQPGLNNTQFTLRIAERLVAHPEEFDNLPKSTQDMILNQINGQRQDAFGNAWNPSTATTDIYGNAFVTPAQQKARLRVARQRQRRRNIEGGRIQTGPKAPNAPNAPQQATGGFTGSYGLISFNTATG